jgi:hypothetical protein
MKAMKRIICILMCAALAVPLISCGRIQGAQKIPTRRLIYLTTVITVTAYDESQTAFRRAFAEFISLLEGIR